MNVISIISIEVNDCKFLDLLNLYLLSSQVLFFGCGDMKSALYTASLRSPAFPGLQIHMNDICGSIIARNILIAHIITSHDFDPKNQKDLQYLWDVWYTTQWDDVTSKRFLKDVNLLLTGHLHKNINS